jgi:hypothetical protein
MRLSALQPSLNDLIPRGCSVESQDSTSVLYAPDGEMVAIVLGPNSIQRSRLIACLPGIVHSIDLSLERGMLLPLVMGYDEIELTVFQPSQKLPAGCGR